MHEINVNATEGHLVNFFRGWYGDNGGRDWEKRKNDKLKILLCIEGDVLYVHERHFHQIEL